MRERENPWILAFVLIPFAALAVCGVIALFITFWNLVAEHGWAGVGFIVAVVWFTMAFVYAASRS